MKLFHAQVALVLFAALNAVACKTDSAASLKEDPVVAANQGAQQAAQPEAAMVNMVGRLYTEVRPNGAAYRFDRQYGTNYVVVMPVDGSNVPGYSWEMVGDTVTLRRAAQNVYQPALTMVLKMQANGDLIGTDGISFTWTSRPTNFSIDVAYRFYSDAEGRIYHFDHQYENNFVVVTGGSQKLPGYAWSMEGDVVTLRREGAAPIALKMLADGSLVGQDMKLSWKK